MKKIFTTVAVVCSLFVSISTFAQGTKNAGQDAATNKGDVLFDFGVGFVGNEYSYSDNNNFNQNNGYYNKSSYQLPTFSVALQKAFWEDITIGGQLSFNTGGTKYDDYYKNDGYYRTGVKNTNTNTFVTARGEYHFNRLIGLDRKFDLYAGVLLGLRISFYNDQYTDGYNDPNGPNPGNWGPRTHVSKGSDVAPILGPFGGFRYYFAKNLGVYGEVGWAITVIRGGLVWRL